MSVFNTTTATCTTCGHTLTISWAASVNADRRPDLRAEVLDGRFQAQACESCGTEIRLPPHLTYIDMGRGNWVLVQAATDIGAWKTHEAEAQALFDEAFGPGAPASSRDIAAGVRPRLCFGWPPLREKLIATELGLDDVTLELLKLAIMRGVPGAPVGVETLRLAGGDATTLQFEVTDDDSEAVSAGMEVPRALYDGIAADTAAWAALREKFEGKALVDVVRLTLEG